MLKLIDDYLPLFLTTIHKTKVYTTLLRSNSIREGPEKSTCFVSLSLVDICINEGHTFISILFMNDICVTTTEVTDSGSIFTQRIFRSAPSGLCFDRSVTLSLCKFVYMFYLTPKLAKHSPELQTYTATR